MITPTYTLETGGEVGGNVVVTATSVTATDRVNTDIISEETLDSGVTVDGVLIKDGKIPTSALDTTTVTDKLVTNGDSHDHNGGDGAQIDHVNLTNKGTNTHAQIDTFVASKAAASGLASLDGSSKVVQDPANATATPTASKIPIASAGGKLDGWITAPAQSVANPWFGTPTTSRAVGTAYQNLTGRPLFVSIVGNSATIGAILIALTDSAATPTTQVNYAYVNVVNQAASVKFIVLPGNYYKVTMTNSPTLGLWAEWTL